MSENYKTKKSFRREKKLELHTNTRIDADKVHYFIQPSLSLVITQSANLIAWKLKNVSFPGRSVLWLSYLIQKDNTNMWWVNYKENWQHLLKFEVDLHQNTLIYSANRAAYNNWVIFFMSLWELFIFSLFLCVVNGKLSNLYVYFYLKGVFFTLSTPRIYFILHVDFSFNTFGLQQ